jgi:Peptidase inhibitor I78 family
MAAVPDAPPTMLPAPRASKAEPGDLAPCPGINPDIRRPAGSNCLGIVPAACGADRVASLVGQKDSPALRQDVARRTGHDRIRWIGAGEAVTDDLRPDRLNIEFDTARRVAVTDCY